MPRGGRPESASKPTRISLPTGTEIAFTGEYDGNIDVFVIPAAGGVPKRLTCHPAPTFVAGWTPDGQADPVPLHAQQLLALCAAIYHAG
jgi:hypothetical protein